LVDFNAHKYVHNENVPLYKLHKIHYWFDMNNSVSSYNGKFNIEYFIKDKSDVYISNYYGYITNFKLYDIYNDNLMDLLQMYPTNQHLLINDTARKVVGRPGVAIK
jgi:hydrogenase maturation factor HypF (carbamoyltransferase family)